MSKYPPRRFICNFIDGTAEFNENDTPPAEEYLSLYEYKDLKNEYDNVCKFANAYEEQRDNLSSVTLETYELLNKWGYGLDCNCKPICDGCHLLYTLKEVLHK